jgi:hypothetical protein
MRVKARATYLLVGTLATQLMLGCQAGDKDEVLTVPTATVPSGLDHPSQMVGNWQEAKGKQTVQLNADGSGEIVTKVSIGANVTKGAPQNFDQKVQMKWGVKDKSFYFTDIKGSPPLNYDWTMANGNIVLTNSGSKLTYSRIETKPTK